MAVAQGLPVAHTRPCLHPQAREQAKLARYQKWGTHVTLEGVGTLLGPSHVTGRFLLAVRTEGERQ